MNIYAIRDRMIDYFIQPFAAPGDHEVLAAIAGRINQPGDTDAITQAPHHFEIWRVAKFNQDTGHLEVSKEFLADCSSLVRGSVRTVGRPGDQSTESAPGARTSPPEGDRSRTHSGVTAIQDAPRGASGERAGHDQGSERGPSSQDT